MRGLIEWLFKTKTAKSDATGGIIDIKALDELNQQIDGDSRMQKVIEWCEKVDNSKLKVIQYAILNDSDLGVKMAGLKRIHLFKDKESVRQFLKDEKMLIVGRRCEPYYSMALSRTGLISQEEFESRISA